MPNTYTEQIEKRLEEYYNRIQFLEKENQSLKRSLDILQNSSKLIQNLAVRIVKLQNDGTSTISSIIEEETKKL